MKEICAATFCQQWHVWLLRAEGYVEYVGGGAAQPRFVVRAKGWREPKNEPAKRHRRWFRPDEVPAPLGAHIDPHYHPRVTPPDENLKALIHPAARKPDWRTLEELEKECSRAVRKLRKADAAAKTAPPAEPIQEELMPFWPGNVPAVVDESVLRWLDALYPEGTPAPRYVRIF